MEAKDLMISDWVLDGSHIAQIVLLTCDGIIGTTFNESSNIEVVEPIPLTTEILEKNGFVKESERCWVLSDEYTGDNVIVLYEVANAFAITTEGMTIGLQNVHELQHLFKLCGIDKDIEL